MFITSCVEKKHQRGDFFYHSYLPKHCCLLLITYLPMIFLLIAAELSENIERISVKDPETDPAEYVFQIRCTRCGEDADKPVVVNAYEKHDIPGSRGEANLVMKCKFCGSENTIDMNHFETALSQDQASNIDRDKRKKHGLGDRKLDIDNCAAILQLDTRGWDLREFIFSSIPFVAELTSGKKMEFKFEDGEDSWYDYDDDSGEEVYVTNFKTQFVKGK